MTRDELAAWFNVKPGDISERLAAAFRDRPVPATDEEQVAAYRFFLLVVQQQAEDDAKATPTRDDADILRDFGITEDAPAPAIDADAAKRYMRNLTEHIALVGGYLQMVIATLASRIIEHDQSKWGDEEFDPYARQQPAFEKATYGSEEYIACCRAIKPAIVHHLAVNRHHPEFHGEAGVTGMNLIDVVEMTCDWMAASRRGGGTLAGLNLSSNFARFGIDGQLGTIITNTVQALSAHNERPPASTPTGWAGFESEYDG